MKIIIAVNDAEHLHVVRQRVAQHTDEILQVLRACWDQDPTSFHGEHYYLDQLRVLPKPAHPIPLWIGGGSEAAYVRAARFGDGFQLIGLAPDTVVAPLARLRQDHPDATAFPISLRTGWDPQGMDRGQIADEHAADQELGRSHVVCAPWRSDPDDWLRSMELLAEIVLT